MTVRGLRSGMLDPLNPKHAITSGDRTRIIVLTANDLKQHPGMTYSVWFNGNE